MSVCGIYAIENLLDGTVYIGSSIDCKNRWHVHRYQLRTGTHFNKRLVNAWAKHGEANFRFFVLEECSEDQLAAKEQAHLDRVMLTPGADYYNTSRFTERPRMSQEARQKLSLRMKGNKYTLGRVRPECERKATALGNRGKKRSLEAIENYRKAAQRREAEKARIAKLVPVETPEWLIRWRNAQR